ncbi:MAG TPA: hypothetical protein VGK89_13600 [Candidatus Eisenbacteria bacterium]
MPVRPPAGVTLAILALAASGSAPAPMRTIHFSGLVRGGQRFERLFTDSLRFVLDPETLGREGWTLRVLAADSTADFAGIATPPFHGPNPLDLEAWHFRNADNTGPNRGEPNMPQEQRWFEFCLSTPGYRVAVDALDVALWPGNRGRAAQDSAQTVWEAVPRGTGQLTVTERRLDGLGAGQRPWFESMRFTVELKLPAHAPHDRRH